MSCGPISGILPKGNDADSQNLTFVGRRFGARIAPFDRAARVSNGPREARMPAVPGFGQGDALRQQPALGKRRTDDSNRAMILLDYDLAPSWTFASTAWMSRASSASVMRTAGIASI